LGTPHRPHLLASLTASATDTGSLAEPRSDALEPESKTSVRWQPIVVLSAFSFLSFLDRQLLAALAPTLKSHFHLSNADYGLVVSAFAFAYMLSTPVAGWIVDRLGLRACATAAIACWSAFSAATGLAAGLPALLLCRVGLGLSESVTIPASAKANAIFLAPREMALGSAVQQIGFFAGGIAAPLLVVAVAPRLGWTSVFLIAGILGCAWMPIWLAVSRGRRAMQPGTGTRVETIIPIVQDRRMWAIAVCSLTVMTLYSLWLNWTTIFFVQHLGLTQDVANRYFAWLPPLFATLGGLVGGWLAFRKIGAGSSAVRVRLTLCWICVPLCLVTAAVPLAVTPRIAALGIGISFFGCMMLVTNLHVMPIDVFGKERAAFTSSILTFCFALAQTVTAPIMGRIVDRFGFAALCAGLAVLPIVGLCIVTFAMREHAARPLVAAGVVPTDEHAVL